MDEVQVLFKLSGPNLDRDEIIVTTQGLTIGRTADNGLQFESKEISRHHVRIFYQEEQFFVEDLESSNGTWVNDVRVRPGQPRALQRGDAIRCGPFLMVYDQLMVSVMPDLPAPEPEPEPDAGALVLPPLAAMLAKMPGAEPAKDQPLSPGTSVVDAPTMVQIAPDLAAQYEGLLGKLGTSGLEASPPGGAGSPPTTGTTTGLGRLRRAPDNYPQGIPTDRSTWLQYLPSIYSDDEFIGRYLLVFESVLSPMFWILDSMDLYFTPDIAPPEWLRWFAGWFDLLLIPELPIERQRRIVGQIGWLFLRRGTKAGMIRLLDLYFGVTPVIEEPKDEPCHFVVKLPLSQAPTPRLGRDVVDRLIMSQKPAFSSYTLEIT